jgi:hypothetical protein
MVVVLVVPSLRCWTKDNSEILIAFGTALLALATFGLFQRTAALAQQTAVLAQETTDLAIQTAKTVDQAEKHHQEGLNGYITIWDPSITFRALGDDIPRDPLRDTGLFKVFADLAGTMHCVGNGPAFDISASMICDKYPALTTPDKIPFPSMSSESPGLEIGKREFTYFYDDLIQCPLDAKDLYGSLRLRVSYKNVFGQPGITEYRFSTTRASVEFIDPPKVAPR